MRLCAILPVFLALTGCASDPESTVTGTAGGITFGETATAYFGGPFLVVSAQPIDCMDLAFVVKSYEDGVAATDEDVAFLQFAFGQTDVATGRTAVDVGASVSATVVNIVGDASRYTRAESGLLVVDAVDPSEDGLATGSFEDVTFEDGTLAGTFTATWCRNLRE
jgi:hypothetical protein